MKQMKPISGYWILILLGILSLIVFIYISRYVHPVNDDFIFALQHKGINWFTSVITSYRSWSGRYLATAVSSLNPYAFSSTPLPLLRCYSGIVTFVFFLSSIAFGVMLCRKTIGLYKSISLGCFLVVSYMSLCPSVSQLFYWFSAYTAYTLSLILTMLFFAILPYKNHFIVVLQAIFAFLIPGGNEVTAILFIATLSYLAYTYRCHRFNMLLFISIIAIITVILSPGNSIRMDYRLSDHPYLWSATVSFGQTIGWIILWMPSLILASLLYIPMFGLRLSKAQIFDTSITKFILFSLAAIFLAHIPPTYGLSSVIIDRTANCLLMYFILFYFWGLNIFLHRHAEYFSDLMSKINRYKTGTVLNYSVLFCFTFMLPLSIDSPIVTALMDIVSGKAENYSNIQTSRLEIARHNSKNRPNSTCSLPTFGTTSKTLFIKDLEDTPDAEFTGAYRTIYDLNCSVYVPSDGVHFEDNFDTIKNLGKTIR